MLEALSPTPGNSRRVVVVGAGPVGLTAALALLSAGLRVDVLEAEPEKRIRPGSRAIYLHRETLMALDRLRPGLATEVARRGQNWSRRRTTYRGREVFRHDYPSNPDPIKHGTSLPQAETEQVLLRAAVAGGATIRWGDPVERVDTRSDGVAVQLGSGATLDAPYVIAADGARSVVRSSIGVSMEGSRSENSFVIIDLEAPADADEVLENTFHYELPSVGGRNVLVVPFKGGWRVDLQCLPDDDVSEWADPKAVEGWIATVMGAAYADRIRWISSYQFLQVIAGSFTDTHDRALLVGEAAHLFAPFGGRGLNSGVIDAVAAANAVAAACAAPDDQRARDHIQAFARERQAAAEHNRACANVALRDILAPSAFAKARRRLLAESARWSRRAGEILDLAPAGPPGGRPGAKGTF